MSAEAIAVVGAAVGLLAVLLPVILTQGASLRHEIDALRAEVGEVRRDLHTLSDRVARIGGCADRAVAPGEWFPNGRRHHHHGRTDDRAPAARGCTAHGSRT